MALKSRASIIDIGGTLSRKGSEFVFQDPPLIDVPHTQVVTLDGAVRKLPDPSKTLKPALGVERVLYKSARRLDNEKGPSGQFVAEMENGDPRVRFVGQWQLGTTSGNGQHVRSDDIGDFIEITFYGTGLNEVVFYNNFLKGHAASVDGGALGPELGFVGGTVLEGLNYPMNVSVPVVSGLPLGNHTVRIENTGGSGWIVFGFEVLNEDTQIQVPQGEILSNGLKYRHNALEAIDFNSGFDGAPTLNGRGGRVREYITPQGVVGKALRQTDASALFGALADHTNEEVIKRLHFRDFGANRNDDFTTLAGASDRAYTMDDGVTSLIGEDLSSLITQGIEVLNGSAGDFWELTFVGTGLDIFGDQSAAVTTNMGEVFIDGVSQGEIQGTIINGSAEPVIHKIISGLPYGTHTIRFLRNTEFVRTSEFIIYGPKKPDIPADAIEIQEYYLMADYVANTITTQGSTGQGVIRNHAAREMIYQGTWAGLTVSTTDIGGKFTSSTTAASTARFQFWGTGFELRFWTSGGALNHTLRVDGDPDTSGFTTSSYGGGTYTPATGLFSNTGWDNTGENGISVSGLPLGLHEIEVEVGGATFFFSGFDVITPIHFPNVKTGQLSLGSAVQLSSETALGGVDFGRAKALLVFDQTTNNILFSKNVAAVLDQSTGVHKIFWEKRFRTIPVIMTGGSPPEARVSAFVAGSEERYKNELTVFSGNSSGTALDAPYFTIVAYGELEGEDE